MSVLLSEITQSHQAHKSTGSTAKMETGKPLPHTIRAFILAPLVPVPLVNIVLALQDYAANSLAVFSIGGFITKSIISILLGSLVFAYPVALVLFMPQHILLSRSNLTGYRHYALIGLTSGLMASTLFFLIQSQTTIPGSLSEYVLLTGSSLVAALSFRYIAGRNKKTFKQRKQTNA